MKQLVYIMITVSILIIFANKCYSQSDRWVYICESEKEGYVLYYDKESIKYIENEILLNIKYTYTSKSKKYQDMKESRLKLIIYCGEDYILTKSCTNYYRNDEIDSFNINEKMDIIPESVSEDIYRIFCKN